MSEYAVTKANHVLCGRQECGASLGLITESNGVRSMRLHEVYTKPPPTGEGAWEPSRRMVDAMRKGRASPRSREVPDTGVTRDGFEKSPAMPDGVATVRCYQCRILRTLDANRLGILAFVKVNRPHESRRSPEPVRSNRQVRLDERQAQAAADDLARDTARVRAYYRAHPGVTPPTAE